MSTQISIGMAKLHVAKEPDICPSCHFSIQTLIETAYFLPGDHFLGGDAEVLYRCPRGECGRGYLVRYSLEMRADGDYAATVASIVPRLWQRPQHPPVVTDISPRFVEIYRQASMCDAGGLDEVSGPGFRKALEFLVKDFGITRYPERAEEIRSAALAQVIARYIDDPRIKSCAERATWLGNDETHYERRWTDRDVSDLKRTIQLSVLWIESLHLTEEYEREMTRAGPSAN